MIVNIPIIMIDKVYDAQLATRQMVVQLAGIPSFIITYPQAGCPPVDEGVIAEKYRSAAVYPMHFHRLRFWPNVLVPVLINSLILSLVLNTLWISQLYSSKSYWGYFLSRIPQELGLGAVRLIVIPLLAPIARQLCKLGFVKYETGGDTHADPGN